MRSLDADVVVLPVDPRLPVGFILSQCFSRLICSVVSLTNARRVPGSLYFATHDLYACCKLRRCKSLWSTRKLVCSPVRNSWCSVYTGGLLSNALLGVPERLSLLSREPDLIRSPLWSLRCSGRLPSNARSSNSGFGEVWAHLRMEYLPLGAS